MGPITVKPNSNKKEIKNDKYQLISFEYIYGLYKYNYFNSNVTEWFYLLKQISNKIRVALFK